MALSNDVFLPSAPANYVSPALAAILSMPDAGLQFQAARDAETKRQILLAKSAEDRKKAEMFFELAPEYKRLQMLKLQDEIARLRSEAPMRALMNEARAENYRASAAKARSVAAYNDRDRPRAGQVGQGAVNPSFFGDFSDQLREIDGAPAPAPAQEPPVRFGIGGPDIPPLGSIDLYTPEM